MESAVNIYDCVYASDCAVTVVPLACYSPLTVIFCSPPPAGGDRSTWMIASPTGRSTPDAGGTLDHITANMQT